MTTILRLCLCVLTLAVPVGIAARADEPPTSGRVLILDNERTLEGDIQRHGDQFCIRRSAGETWIPAAKVLRLCADRAEAYRYLRSRANLVDPDERLRLAQWCHVHGLREQALAEVTEAVGLRPTHGESRRLMNSLQRALATPTAAPTPRTETEAEPGLLPPVDLGPEALSQFVTKVQPILMNACASCHATGRGGSFKLVRSLMSGPASMRIVQHNLAATLGQINVERLQGSSLLVKALSAHGDADQPPLRGRQVAAYHTLENWVRTTLAKNPALREVLGKTVASLPAAEPKALPRSVAATAEEMPALPPTAVKSTNWAVESKTKEKQEKAAPADPFDPAIFNRQLQPPMKP